MKLFTLKLLFTSLFLLFIFNVNSQSWIQIDDFPSSARDDGASFVIGNKAYCGTGFKVGWTETKDYNSEIKACMIRKNDESCCKKFKSEVDILTHE